MGRPPSRPLISQRLILGLVRVFEARFDPVSEKVSEKVLDRYHIVDAADVQRAMRRVQAAAQALPTPASKALPPRERKGRA